MAKPIKCKRIIAGKTYNTETSTKLGEVESEYHTEMLFKTRHGAYFAYGEYPHEPEERIIPLESLQAEDWMEQYMSADALEAEFGEKPDAGDDEARITLRIPESLRKRIALIAAKNDQSLNAWILRCLERCATTPRRRGL